MRNGRLVLWIGGQANKNRDRFEQKFNDLVDTFEPSWKGRQPRPLGRKNNRS